MILHRRRLIRCIPILLATLASLALRLITMGDALRTRINDGYSSDIFGPDFDLIIAHALPSFFIFLAMIAISPLGILMALACVRDDREIREEAALTSLDPRTFFMMHCGMPLVSSIWPTLVLIPVDLFLSVLAIQTGNISAGIFIFGSTVVITWAHFVHLMLGLLCIRNVFRNRSKWNVILLLFGFPFLIISTYFAGIGAFVLVDGQGQAGYILLASLLTPPIFFLLFGLLHIAFRSTTREMYRFDN